MLFRKRKKGIKVEDVLQLFGSQNVSSMLDIPFRSAVTADLLECFNGGLFNLVISMVQNGFTTGHVKSRPGSASVTYSAVNIHDMLVKNVPVYNQQKMLQELYDILPIMVQRFVLYVQTKPLDYQTITKISANSTTKHVVTSIGSSLLDGLTEFICDFEDIHASTPAFKHLVSANILAVLNYETKINTKLLKSLL